MARPLTPEEAAERGLPPIAPRPKAAPLSREEAARRGLPEIPVKSEDAGILRSAFEQAKYGYTELDLPAFMGAVAGAKGGASLGTAFPVLGPLTPVVGALTGGVVMGIAGDFLSEDSAEDMRRKAEKQREIESLTPDSLVGRSMSTALGLIPQTPLFAFGGWGAKSAGVAAQGLAAKASAEGAKTATQKVAEKAIDRVGSFVTSAPVDRGRVAQKILQGTIPGAPAFGTYTLAHGGEANEVAIDYLTGAALGGWLQFAPGVKAVEKGASLPSMIPRKARNFLIQGAGEVAALALGHAAKAGDDEPFTSETLAELAGMVIALRGMHQAFGTAKIASQPWIQRTLEAKFGEEDAALMMKRKTYQTIERFIDESGILKRMPEGFGREIKAGMETVARLRAEAEARALREIEGITGKHSELRKRIRQGKMKEQEALDELDLLAKRNRTRFRNTAESNSPLANKLAMKVAADLGYYTDAKRFDTKTSKIEQFHHMPAKDIYSYPARVRQRWQELQKQIEAIPKMDDAQFSEFIRNNLTNEMREAGHREGIPEIGATRAQWQEALVRPPAEKDARGRDIIDERAGLMYQRLNELRKTEREMNQIIAREILPRTSELGNQWRIDKKQRQMLDATQKQVDQIIERGRPEDFKALQDMGALYRNSRGTTRSLMKAQRMNLNDNTVTLYRSMEPELVRRLESGDVALLDARLAGGVEILPTEGRALVKFRVPIDSIIGMHSDGIRVSFSPHRLQKGKSWEVVDPVQAATLKNFLNTLEYRDTALTKGLRALKLDQFVNLPRNLTPAEREHFAETAGNVSETVAIMTKNHGRFLSLLQLRERFAATDSKISDIFTRYVDAHNGNGIDPLSGSNSMANAIFTPFAGFLSEYRWSLGMWLRMRKRGFEIHDRIKEKAKIQRDKIVAESRRQRDALARGVPRESLPPLPKELLETKEDIRRVITETVNEVGDKYGWSDKSKATITEAVIHLDSMTRWVLDPTDNGRPLAENRIDYTKFPRQKPGERQWHEYPGLLGVTRENRLAQGMRPEEVEGIINQMRTDFRDMTSYVYKPNMRSGLYALSITPVAKNLNAAILEQGRKLSKRDRMEPDPKDKNRTEVYLMFESVADRNAAATQLQNALRNAKAGDQIELPNGEMWPLPTRGSNLRVNESNLRTMADEVRLRMQGDEILNQSFKLIQKTASRLQNEIDQLKARDPNDPEIRTLQNRLDRHHEALWSINETARGNMVESAFSQKFREKKDVPGAELDMFRAYGDYFLTAGRYLARTKHAPAIEGAIQEMDTIVRNIQQGIYNGRTLSPETSASLGREMERVRDYLQRHYRDTTNNVEDASLIKGAMFNYFFAAVPRQFFAAVAQVPMVAYPYLGARYGDVAAFKALNLASKDLAQHFYHAKRGIRGARDLHDMEVLMRDAGIQQGFITQNQAVELGRVRERTYQTQIGHTFSHWALRGLDALTMHFTIGERLSREVTFMTAIRLETHRQWRSMQDAGAFKGDLKEFMTKVQLDPLFKGVQTEIFNAGKKAVQETMFEYGAFNQPELFRGKVKSVIFLFQTFTQHMLHMLYNDRASSRILLGLVTMSGFMGLPFADDFARVMNALMQQFYPNQPIDVKADLFHLINEAGSDPIAWAHGMGRVGPVDWMHNALNTAGIQTPGLDRALGTIEGNFGDFSRSVSMEALVPGLQPMTDLMQFGSYGDIPQNILDGFINFMGPVGSPISNIGSLLMGGEATPTLDKFIAALPSGARNIMKAVDVTFPEITRDGMRLQGYASDRKDVPIAYLSQQQRWAQVAGFQPEPLLKNYMERDAFYAAKQFFSGRRMELYALLEQAIRAKEATGDDTLQRQRIRQIREYNSAVRQQGFHGMEINSDQIRAAIRSRGEGRILQAFGLPRQRSEFMLQKVLYERLFGAGSHDAMRQERRTAGELTRAQYSGSRREPEEKVEPVPSR